jgi:outer membrane protein TolC
MSSAAGATVNAIHGPRIPLNRRPALAALASLALAATGCAHYTPRSVDLKEGAASLQQRRIDDPALASRVAAYHSLHVAHWPPAVYGPDELFAAALVLNPALGEARARLAASVAAVRTARQLPNPVLATAFDKYQNAQSDAAPWAWSLSLDMPLNALLNRPLQTALANAGVRAARLDYATQLWRTRSTVRSALRDLLFARRLSELNASLLDAEERIVGAWQHRREAGEAAPAEFQQATLLQLQAQRDAAALAARISAAETALARAIGVSTDAVFALPLAWPDLLSPQAPADLPAQRTRALLSRSEIERALSDYDAAERTLQLQIRQQYPQVSAGPSYSYDQGVRKLGISATVSLPIFNRNQGPIAEAEAQRDVAGRHLESVQAGVLSDIDGAAAALARSLESLDHARSQQALSERLATQVDVAFQAGAEDRIGQMGARYTAIVAAQNALEAANRAQEARAALEDALQTPLDQGPSLEALSNEVGVTR